MEDGHGPVVQLVHHHFNIMSKKMDIRRNGGSRRILKNGLTHKETAFTKKIVEQIVNGEEINGTKAALEVYDTTNPKSAGVIASDNLNKVVIQNEMEQALSAAGLSREKIMANLTKIASHDAVRYSGETVLKANIEALKLIGAYPDKKSMHLNLNLSGKVKGMSYDEAKAAHEEANKQNADLINLIESPVS
jgi:hypothetical protein